MRINAVICEYNPFHNGHKYQLEKIKKNNNLPIAAIMSGNFTQRGDVAIADKFTRAETAVHNGADLVIELPAVFACSTAESFAEAGVKIAEALGCTENLCFSAEEDDPELLIKAAELFNDETFNLEVKALMKEGLYYPLAVEKAFKKTAPGLAEAVATPNNILAVEYLKALSGTNIKPMIIKRKGSIHDSDIISENISSASNIRRMILSGENFKSLVPENASGFPFPADIEKLEKTILYKLRTMSPDEFNDLPEVSEGLHNRIYSAVRDYNSVKEIIDAVKTKRYTHARIRRTIIHALLGISKEEIKREVPYIRALAFNETGATILSEIKKAGGLPLITNVADGYKALDENARRIFDIDLKASDIYSLATDKTTPCGIDFTRALKKL